MTVMNHSERLIWVYTMSQRRIKNQKSPY
jgi:hypothetical protein